MGLNAREVCNCPDQSLAITNKVYVHPDDPLSSSKFAECDGFVYNLEPHNSVPPGSAAFNAIQRKNLRVSTGDGVSAPAIRAVRRGQRF